MSFCKAQCDAPSSARARRVTKVPHHEQSATDRSSRPRQGLSGRRLLEAGYPQAPSTERLREATRTGRPFGEAEFDIGGQQEVPPVLRKRLRYSAFSSPKSSFHSAAPISGSWLEDATWPLRSDAFWELLRLPYPFGHFGGSGPGGVELAAGLPVDDSARNPETALRP